MLSKRITAIASALCLAWSNMAGAVDAKPDFYNALGSSRGENLIEVEVNKGKALRLSTAASSVAISNPNIADVQVVSPRLLYINGKAVGETSMIAVDAQDNVISEGTIVVTHNLSRFKRAAGEMMPGEPPLDVQSTDNAIILKGKVGSPVEAEKLQRLATSFLQNDNQSIINMMDTSDSDQVMLKVKIVELARSELKRFGINWENVINANNFVFGLARGRDIVTSGEFTRSPDSDNSIGIGFRDGTQDINAVIDMLENDGIVSVLAEPNLTTRSGQTASFLAGGEIPIPVPGADGTVTIEYRQFGVSLQFTPVVLTKNKISLTVLPEVSALSEQNSITGGDFGTIPSITTRRASTTVDLGTGQTFAIAGLLRSEQNSNDSKVPFLGDIPGIGALFRTTEYENNQTELVILVTPYLVRPVDSPDKLLTPMDGYTPPSDAERIFLGKLHGETEQVPASKKPTGVTPAPMGGMGGQSGFLMR